MRKADESDKAERSPQNRRLCDHGRVDHEILGPSVAALAQGQMCCSPRVAVLSSCLAFALPLTTTTPTPATDANPGLSATWCPLRSDGGCTSGTHIHPHARLHTRRQGRRPSWRTAVDPWWWLRFRDSCDGPPVLQ